MKVDFIEINILPEFYRKFINFLYQIFAIKFPIMELIFNTDLKCVFLGSIFVGLG
jgi:hypothetical protein